MDNSQPFRRNHNGNIFCRAEMKSSFCNSGRKWVLSINRIIPKCSCEENIQKPSFQLLWQKDHLYFDHACGGTYYHFFSVVVARTEVFSQHDWQQTFFQGQRFVYGVSMDPDRWLGAGSIELVVKRQKSGAATGSILTGADQAKYGWLVELM